MKRTGLIPAFFFGGLLAAAVPVLNMAFRSEMYLGLATPPIRILMDANWQIMSMLNILLVTAGVCLMYHTEYADNAIQRICTLPAKESRLFFGKSAFLVLLCAVILAVEAAGMAFCIFHWFGRSGGSGSALSAGLGSVLKSFGYAFLLMLPVKSFVLSLFPFAMPFQILTGTVPQTARHFMIAAVAELLVIAAGELIFLKLRRSFT